MPALRQGQAVCGLPVAAAALRGLRSRLCFHRCRRWPGGVHHPDRGLHRRRFAALIVEVNYQPPFWVHAVLWLPLILLTTLLPLRPMKALLIALQYHHKAAGGPADRARAAMSERRDAAARSLIPAVIDRCVMVAVLLALGVWQLERRGEKHALIAALDERLARRAGRVAAAGALERPDARARRIPPRDVARRSSIRPRWRWSLPSARALRKDVSGPGVLGVHAGAAGRRRDGVSSIAASSPTRCRLPDRAGAARRRSTLDRLHPLSGKRRLAHAGRRSRQAALVRARSSAMARALGWGDGGAVLYRSGRPGAGRRRAEAGAAAGQSARTNICNMPSPGSGSPGAVAVAFGVLARGPAARSSASL